MTDSYTAMVERDMGIRTPTNNGADVARSHAANAAHKAGVGSLTLYAIHEKRQPDTLILVVERDADLACDRINKDLKLNWDTTMTVSRRIQRNVDAEPGVVSAFRIAHP